MQPRALRALLRFVVTLLSLSGGSAVNAHSTSTAYLEVDATSLAAPTLQWRIALRDLDALLDLDANGDGQLVWGEVQDRATDINALAASSMVVKSGAAACVLRFDSPRYVRVADAGYAHLVGTAACNAGGSLTLDYRLFEGVDPSHRMLLSMQGANQTRILEPGAAVTVSAADATAQMPSGFSGFLSSGMAHIVGGYDHVLFLLCLLLPAVLQRQHTANSGRWIARENVTSSLLTVIWIATAFTAAHSLTLGLAAFGVVRIPASVIEPLIALTILFAALNNVWPVVTRRLATVAFGFGLVHGFGFAEVLAPLSLPRSDLALALLGFNLGVELGQIAIVAGAFLVLATLRRWQGYARWILALGSALIANIATLWFVERVFDVSILGL